MAQSKLRAVQAFKKSVHNRSAIDLLYSSYPFDRTRSFPLPAMEKELPAHVPFWIRTSSLGHKKEEGLGEHVPPKRAQAKPTVD